MSPALDNELFEFLQARLANRLHVLPESISPSTRLDEDLCVDSLTAIELLIEVEELFDVIVTDHEAAQLETVGEAAQFIAERRGFQ